MNIITGYRGEPHITSDQDRAKNEGAFGTGMYILDVGDQLAAEVISANEIRIRDGVLCMNGCVANITEGAYDSCTISNGTQGMLRSDLIVARYTKDAETNIEDISLVVIEGTPAASSPSDPSYNNGDIQQGDSPVDFPLYRVNINGVNVSGTTLLASKVRTQAETDTLLGSTSISGIGNGTVTGALSTLNSNIDTVISYTVYAPYYCYVKKKAGVVYIYGYSASGLTLTGDNAWHTLTTLPVAYRPSDIAYFSGATPGGQAIAFRVGTSGAVDYTTNANTSYWSYGGSFVI